MIKRLLSLAVTAAAIWGGSQILPGVEVDGYQSAGIAALLLAVVNTIVKPILKFLTMPITWITLGLFLVVINGVMIILVEYLMKHFQLGNFETHGFLWAIIMALFVSVVTMILEKVIGLGGDED